MYDNIRSREIEKSFGGNVMSTMTLKSNAAASEKTTSTLKDRIANYFMENHKTFVLGLYVISGKMPSVEVLRSMKML